MGRSYTVVEPETLEECIINYFLRDVYASTEAKVEFLERKVESLTDIIAAIVGALPSQDAKDKIAALVGAEKKIDGGFIQTFVDG